MELTEMEMEIISWFLIKNWDEFLSEAEDAIGVNGIHRLAEKLGVDTSSKKSG